MRDVDEYLKAAEEGGECVESSIFKGRSSRLNQVIFVSIWGLIIFANKEVGGVISHAEQQNIGVSLYGGVPYKLACKEYVLTFEQTPHHVNYQWARGSNRRSMPQQ